MLFQRKIKKSPQRIAVAHGPHMGDGISCLPLAGVLKQKWPQVHITCIGPLRFKPVLMASPYLDDFLSTEDAVSNPQSIADLKLEVLLNPFPDLEVAIAAAQAKVPVRIGNLGRGKLLRYCNTWVLYGRRDSHQHEAMLNLKELKGLGIRAEPKAHELHQHIQLSRIKPLSPKLAELLSPQTFNLILHSRSSGNGREWPLAHFATVARGLSPQRYRIFLTGVDADREHLRKQVPELLEQAHVTDLFGQLSVEELVSFTHAADGLIASGTGPLHLAAALGIRTLGLFPPRTPIDVQRWGPIGPRAETLTLPGHCSPKSGGCPRRTIGEACACMERITPQQVLTRIQQWNEEMPPRQTATAVPG